MPGWDKDFQYVISQTMSGWCYDENVMVSSRLDFLTRHNEKNVGDKTALMDTAWARPMSECLALT